jgi:hypothetical protein
MTLSIQEMSYHRPLFRSLRHFTGTRHSFNQTVPQSPSISTIMLVPTPTNIIGKRLLNSSAY